MKPNSGHHFRVLGIAMVVDQVGIGPRMVLRYPAAVEDDELDQKGNSTAAADDIFFRLTARQMAKLFRPKRTLCRQPLTLSVGGTVFCCRAILFVILLSGFTPGPAFDLIAARVRADTPTNRPNALSELATVRGFARQLHGCVSSRP